MEQYLEVMRPTPFFSGLSDQEILSILHCVNARVAQFDKHNTIFHIGDTTREMGLVLSGSVFILQDDIWGHRNIVSVCQPGDFFGESYAATPGAILNVSVEADTDCTIMFLEVGRLMSTCSTVCQRHQQLIRNMVQVLAGKLLVFNDKITHVSKRSTRDKLLSYLSSESLRQKSLSFDIPYDRQQLADYLCVERSAMSSELSKLQKEGLLRTSRKHFDLYSTIEQ